MAENYVITDVERRAEVDPKGRFISLYRVYFDYAEGKGDYVDIPEALYTPEEVDRVVGEIASRHLAILAL